MRKRPSSGSDCGFEKEGKDDKCGWVYLFELPVGHPSGAVQEALGREWRSGAQEQSLAWKQKVLILYPTDTHTNGDTQTPKLLTWFTHKVIQLRAC